MSKLKRLKRGWLELTKSTFHRMLRYMHQMPQFGDPTFYYCALPVLKTNSRKDVRVMPGGERKSICFPTN